MAKKEKKLDELFHAEIGRRITQPTKRRQQPVTGPSIRPTPNYGSGPRWAWGCSMMVKACGRCVRTDGDFLREAGGEVCAQGQAANLIRVGRMIMLGARSSPQGSVGERN
jgi:hypothetical protein